MQTEPSWGADDWQSFSKGVSARFLSLPLSRYYFAIDFVEFSPDDSATRQLSNQMASAAVAAVRGHPDCSLSALSQRAEKSTLAGIYFGHPVYDFQVQLSRDSLLIGKQDCTLEELLLTLPLMKAVARQLFGEESRISLRQSPFLQWAFKSAHIFELNCRVGQRLSDESISATNLDIARHFVNTDETGFFGTIAPEQVLRGDSTTSVVKTIAGRRRVIFTTAQAPWNVTQRDLSLRFSMSTGDAPGEVVAVVDDDYDEFEIAVSDFYRDLVLKRILPHVFNDIAVFGR